MGNQTLRADGAPHIPGETNVIDVKTIPRGGNIAPLVVPVRVIQVNEIPEIMRSQHGWAMGAALMEEWLSNPAQYELTPEIKKTDFDTMKFEDPKYAPYLVDDIVTMAWALGFDYFKTPVLARSRLGNCATPKGKRLLLGKILKNLPPDKKAFEPYIRKIAFNETSPILDPPSETLKTFRHTIGSKSDKAYRLNAACLINQFDEVENPEKIPDDIYAALARFSVKFVAVGEIYFEFGNSAVNIVNTATSYLPIEIASHAQDDIQPSALKMTVEDIGVFIYDSYDFEGRQPLGTWSADGLVNKTTGRVRGGLTLGGAEFFRIGTNIWNSSFTDWRKRHNQGKDFIVMSDIYWTGQTGIISWP